MRLSIFALLAINIKNDIPIYNMDIQQTTSGKVIKSPKGYKAYVPNPLPPQINWNRTTSGRLQNNYLPGIVTNTNG